MLSGKDIIQNIDMFVEYILRFFQSINGDDFNCGSKDYHSYFKAIVWCLFLPLQTLLCHSLDLGKIFTGKNQVGEDFK